MGRRTNRLARVSLIILVNVALLIALLVMIEGVSSYMFFFRELAHHALRPLQHHTQYDSEIGWVGLPNLDIPDIYGPGAGVRTNASGFRNAKDFPAKREPEARRVVCSGDSVTFGQYVGNEHTFCHLLAEMDPRVESINMGQVGYGVDQAYLWYTRASEDLDVDVHVFSFITHNFLRMKYDEFLGFPRPQMVVEEGELVVTNAPLRRSAYAMPWYTIMSTRWDQLRTVQLTNLIRKKLNLEPRKVPGAWDARDDEEVKEVLAQLFEDLRDYDAARSRATVLVYLPSIEELQQPTAELADWVSFIESNARRLNISFVDLVSELSELPAAEAAELYVDGYHLSESGNALVARRLFRHLETDERTSSRLD